MTIPPAADSPTEEAKPTLLPPPAPLDGFSIDEFKSRRKRLREACPDGVILIRGATEDELPGAAPLRYSQNAMFFYLTGVDTPGGFLLMLPDDMPAPAGLKKIKPEVKEILFLPARNGTAEIWSGPKLGPGEETEKSTGIERVIDAGQMWGALAAYLKRNPVLYTVSPYGENARGTREYALIARLRDIAPIVQPRDVSLAIARLRMVKSPAELERLGKAIATTTIGHKAARGFIARGAGRHEYEVEARVLEAFRAAGGALAFASIVGGGHNATVLHYEHNDAPLKDGDLVVVDIGARFGHYCGDITRTYPVGGRFGARQREVYQLVLDAHRRAVSDFKPGKDTLLAMSERCKEFLKTSPMRSKDGEGKERTMDHFMPHSLGHHLGLDVHDAGDNEMVVPTGSVITIEPGIYLPGEGIGARIEDDYLVTKKGLERVGPPLEVEVDELERAMRE